MQIWTFLHIASMFAAVTITFGGEWYAYSSIWRRDVAALRAFRRIAGRAEGLSGILAIAGIVFGLVAAVVGGWDLLQGWLVIAYVLVAAAIILGVVGTPYFNRVMAAVEGNEGDAPGPELDALLRSPQARVWPFVDTAIVVLIIADMVFKPTF